VKVKVKMKIINEALGKNNKRLRKVVFNRAMRSLKKRSGE
jgi:hypothetical protein